MSDPTRAPSRRRRGAALVATMLATAITTVAPASAAPEPPVAHRAVVAVRSFPTNEHGVDVPAAVTYRADIAAFAVIGDGQYLELNATDDLFTRAPLAPGVSAGIVTFDPTTKAVAIVDATGVSHLTRATGGEQMVAEPVTEARFRAPAAATYDPEGTLYVIDHAGRALSILQRDGSRSDVDLGDALGGPAAGLAHDPTDDQLYLTAADGRRMIRLSDAGQVGATYDLSPADLERPGGMVFAPTSDSTDAPENHSLYIADGTGLIVEITPDPGVVGQAARPVAEAVNASLLRTYDLSAAQPPSPDSAGVAWLPDRGILMASDSEVNEMAIYAGRNLFAVNPASGSVGNAGATTVGFSNEPTGLGYNPSNQHLFVSDDDANEIYEVDAGGDGTYGNGDDSVTSFDTANLGSQDSEDVAYGANTLYVVDGVNREVYVVQPGANGVFDGIPGTGGDDVFSQFDVGVYGALDPEGITYRPSSGTLFIVDHKTDLVFELTTSGNLIDTIDVAAAGAIVAAGIEVAPASDGSPVEHLYLVDRGVDNDTDPTENDGRMYELDGLDPPGNQPPTVQAGLDQTINATALPAGATVSGTVIDDGLPTPPGATNLTWSRVSGPAPVTFANPSTATTSVSFPMAGTYRLRLTADDSQLTGSDELDITIIGPGGPFLFEAGVPTGGDDVEETQAGSVRTTGSDLELVVDGPSTQTVGLRWTGVDIPRGATIEGAYIQFRSDEVSAGGANLTLRGHRIGNAPAFTQTNGNVSSRPPTVASVGWTPPAWPTKNVAGTAQRSPDLSTIVQELVLRNDWSSGNAMAIVISGTGTRTADSIEGGFAPLLHIDYTTDPNGAPVVDAGPDQNVSTDTLPQLVSLAGSASDDGLPNPPATLSTSWTQVAGPATATIQSPTSPTTDVTFPSYGQYTLRLTGNDSARTSTDDITVTITDPTAGPVLVQVVVAAGIDDVEERPNGNVATSSSDLELADDRSQTQTVGLRFTDVAIPAGAIIQSASVQFRSDEVTVGAADLSIAAEKTANAPAFTSASGNVTSRPTTAQAVPWVPAPWPTVNAAGADQRTPDLSPIVQEVVLQPGWTAGNALVLLIDGSGTRTADSYEGGYATVLSIEYQLGGGLPNQPPTVDAGADRTEVATALPHSTTVSAVVDDDGLPDPPATVGTVWSQVSGPATASILTPSSVTSDVTFPAAGTYRLRLTADDSQLTGSDDIDITVVAPGGPVIVERNVLVGSDDAEEAPAGSVQLNSSDLELVVDKGLTQTVGIRFTDIDIPAGAQIDAAYIQFRSDEVSTGAADLVIQGQATPNPATFANTAQNISLRPRTTSSVPWAPAAWTAKNQVGPAQRTPDLSAVVAALVGQGGWTSGNAMAFIITGTGARTADSVNGGWAPMLHIEWSQ